MRRRLAPPVWGVLVTVVVAGALCGLGVWQIQRGRAKQDMLAQRAAARKAAPVPMAPKLAAPGGRARLGVPAYGRRYSVRGHLDGTHQILLDNQVFYRRVGYRVWTPIVLADGTRVMVDRGWVAIGAGGRARPPHPDAPKGAIRMTGLWRALPEPGLRLGAGDVCDKSGWPRVLDYPNIGQLRCQYRGPVANGLLLLDKNDPRGFPRDSNVALTRMPPQRHFGYAAQWFAMAIAVLVIFVAVNLKRRP